MGISNLNSLHTNLPPSPTYDHNQSKIIGFWQIDQDGYTLFIDKPLLKYLQVDHIDELKHHPYHTFFSKNSQELINSENFKRLMGQSSTYEVEMIGLLGARHSMMVHGSPNFDEYGKLIGKTAFFVDITNQKYFEQEYITQNNQLKERIKELRCIYNINDVLHQNHSSLPETLNKVLQLIPPGMQFPEETYARIILDEQEFKTSNYINNTSKLSYPITINEIDRGKIEIGYVEENLDNVNNIFLDEEKELIKSIAQRLGTALHRLENDQKLQHRIAIEETIAEISQMLMTDDKPDYHQILHLIGKTITADRATLFRFNESLTTIHNISEWCKNSNIENFYKAKQFDSQYASPWFDILRRGENLVINSRSDLPKNLPVEKDILHQSKAKSCVAVPIHYKSGDLLGFIGLGMIEHERTWSKEDVRLLRVISEMIGSFWGRKNMEMYRKRFERMLENSSDVVAIFDVNHELQYLNNTGKLLFNFNNPSYHYSFFDLNFDCTPYSLNTILEFAKEIGTWSGECTLSTANNKFLPFSFLLIAPKDKHGNVQFYSLIGRDLSLLRHAEEERDRLFDLSNDLILIANFKGYVKQVNPTCYKSLGWNQKELLTNRWIKYIHPEDKPKLSKIYRQLQQEKSFTNYDLRVLCKDNSYKWISWNFIPIQENQSIYCIGRDINDLKLYEEERHELQEQLLHSQKMQSIGRLAGGVAHDFNNLLTVISGYTDITLQQIPQTSKIYDNLKEVRKASDRASSLTSQLLAFSRKQVLNPTVLNLNHLLLDMEKMLRRLIGEDIVLQTITSDGIGTVRADQAQIEQVIINLAINARDAMPKGGKLTLETRNVYLESQKFNLYQNINPGSYVLIRIQDEGCGMDKDTLDHIFEPFFTTKEVGKGTGLGLSTVYGIINQSNGYIDVESTLNQGTVFNIYLPIFEADMTTQKTKQSRFPEYHGSETILICEDEEIVRNMVSKILQDHGYTIQQATSGDEAIQILSTSASTIQLLITDIIMPGMSGTELAQKVTDQFSDVKIIFMSGYTDDSLIQLNLHNLQKIPFLQKPFSMEKLLNFVRTELDKIQK